MIEREISNEDLTLADIPASDASWDEINEFALTFDGYRACGSFTRCAEVAEAPDETSLSELRASLFFEQRRWRHFGHGPDDEALERLRYLIGLIRERVGSDKSN